LIALHREKQRMKKTPVNPWSWSLKLGYNQAELVEGAHRHLVCAGQTSVDAEGNPQHPGDMRSQIALTFDNLAAVLATAGMSLSSITQLRVFATDVDAVLQNFDVFATRLGSAGAAPPMTLLGVTRLAIPSLMIEVEASAAD
jgi:enamine deaminase RidA (YjgF/YER057c/UK114 family)